MNRMADTPIFKQNLASLKKVDEVKGVVLYKDGKYIDTIPNAEGKRGSLTLYANALGFEDGTLGKKEAEQILTWFGEYKDIAQQNPGAHPNVDRLIPVINGEQNLRAVVDFNIPADLEGRVLRFDELKKQGKLKDEKEKALETFNEVMDLLEKGHLRTAQYGEGGWKVNNWVKKGIMLGFPLGNVVVYNGSHDVQFTDKETFPLRKIGSDAGFRVVPPASGLRRGSYAGKGCTFMPPAYVNVGAFVGQNTMVENLAGSCSQTGKNCHISAGSIIGGVLDPIEATPVIIGDYCLLGEGSGVTQGTRLGDIVTLAPGVHISKATPVIDPIKGIAYTSKGIVSLEKIRLEGSANRILTFYDLGDRVMQEKDSSYGPEIPSGALVIPGMSVSSRGDLKVTPMIAKYISKPEERAYALEEALRK